MYTSAVRGCFISSTKQFEHFFNKLTSWNRGLFVNVYIYIFLWGYCMFQRQSLRDFVYIKTKYFNKLAKHYLEGNLIKGKKTNVSGAGFLDFINLKSEATVNLTTGKSENMLTCSERHAQTGFVYLLLFSCGFSHDYKILFIEVLWSINCVLLIHSLYTTEDKVESYNV